MSAGERAFLEDEADRPQGERRVIVRYEVLRVLLAVIHEGHIVKEDELIPASCPYCSHIQPQHDLDCDLVKAIVEGREAIGKKTGVSEFNGSILLIGG